MIALLLIAVIVAVLLVRLGWRARRGLAISGWGLAFVALLVLTVRDGAWGLAIGTVAAMAAAIALVLHAGWTAPVRHRRPRREAPSIDLPRRSRDLARRGAVFLLSVPVAFGAAQWLAFGAQAAARRGGMVEANAVVTMLFLQPMLWIALMTWQMTRTGPTRMIAAPAGTAALGTLLWGMS